MADHEPVWQPLWYGDLIFWYALAATAIAALLALVSRPATSAAPQSPPALRAPSLQMAHRRQAGFPGTSYRGNLGCASAATVATYSSLQAAAGLLLPASLRLVYSFPAAAAFLWLLALIVRLLRPLAAARESGEAAGSRSAGRGGMVAALVGGFAVVWTSFVP